MRVRCQGQGVDADHRVGGPELDLGTLQGCQVTERSQRTGVLDLILWLAYRLKQVKRPYLITWGVLRDQFGSDVAQGFKFKQSFKADLAAISEVFPKLPAKLGEEGIRLFPANPEDLFVPPKRKLSQPA